MLNDILSGSKLWQSLCRTHICCKVIHQAPYLIALLMCLCHIICGRKISKIAWSILNIKPGRRDHIQTADIRCHIREISICIRVGDLVPGHIDLVIHGEIGIIFFLKTSLEISRLHIGKNLLLYISDIAVQGRNLYPVLQCLHIDQGIALAYVCKYRWFDTSTITDTCVLLDSCCIDSCKFMLYHDPGWIFVSISIEICVFLYQCEIQINGSILKPDIPVSWFWCRIILKCWRCCIQNLLVSAVPVISLIQIGAYHSLRQIDLISWFQSPLFHDICTKYNNHLTVWRLTIVLCQTHMLPGWDIILNNVYTQSDRC